jgi:hypothetical protein
MNIEGYQLTHISYNERKIRNNALLLTQIQIARGDDIVVIRV